MASRLAQQRHWIERQRALRRKPGREQAQMLAANGIFGTAAYSVSARFLFESNMSAKLEARPPFRRRAIESGALEIVGPMLDMRAELILYLGVGLGWEAKLA